MKRVTLLIAIIILAAGKSFSQDFILSNPVFSSNPAVYPGGNLDISFNIFLLEKEFMLSSNPSSDYFTQVKFTFKKLRPVGNGPQGDGAELFTWEMSSNDSTGANKEYYWVGSSKSVLMQPSPVRRKYKISFNNVSVSVNATQMESDIKVSGTIVDPRMAKINSWGNNGAQISTYSIPRKCLPGLDFGDLPLSGKQLSARVISPDCNNDGIPDGPGISVWAGMGLNTEDNQKYSEHADGDEFDDGLELPSGSVVRGMRNNFLLTLSTNAATDVQAYYALWFDWDNDGNFTNSANARGDDMPFFYSGSDKATFNGNKISIPVIVPKNISADFKVRLLISDKPISNMTVETSVANGEVEDYQVGVPQQMMQIKDFSAAANGCTLIVNWKTINAQQAKDYIIEISNNGIEYRQLANVTPAGSDNYSFRGELTDQFKSGIVHVRIKAINASGTSYSEVRTIASVCKVWSLVLYPNPVYNTNTVTIHSKQGLFDGKYKMTLVDNSGKILQVKEILLNKVQDVKYNLPMMGNGNYRIIVSNADGTQNATVDFVKL